jgi:hypothetical protein
MGLCPQKPTEGRAAFSRRGSSPPSLASTSSGIQYGSACSCGRRREASIDVRKTKLPASDTSSTWSWVRKTTVGLPPLAASAANSSASAAARPRSSGSGGMPLAIRYIVFWAVWFQSNGSTAARASSSPVRRKRSRPRST